MRINTAVLAALFAAGVLLAAKFTVTFSLMLILVFSAVISIYAVISSSAARLLHILYVLSFAAGIIITQHYASADLKALNKYTDCYVTIYGRVSELPEGGDSENKRYILNLKSVVCDGVTEETDERLMLTSPEIFEYGDTVTAEGFIEAFDGKMNSSSFDFALYFKSKDIFFKCYSDKAKLYDKRIKDYSLYALSLSVKNNISKLIDRYSSGENAAVLKAVLIGDKSYLSEDYELALRKSGTRRFLYPAYLHICIIVFFVGIFSTILRRRYRDIALSVLLILYAVCESSHPVFLKGCLLMTFITLFRMKFGYVYLLDMLGAVILSVCAANPLLLYDAGFTISVCASVLISAFYKPASKLFGGIKSFYVRRVITLSSLCTAGLWPLFAYYFNGVTIYSIVTALLFIPMTLAVIILSPILFAMLTLFGTAPVAAQIMTTVLWLYIKLPYFISMLPFSFIVIPAVSITFMAAYAAFIYSVWFKTHNDSFKSAAALAAALTLTACEICSVIPKINTMDITFVNVGQGDGTFIKMPFKNEVVLIDGGGGSEYSSDYNPGESIYLPYLQSEGISKADCAIISHCHKDHVQGIIAAVDSLSVKHVFLPAATEEDNEFLIELKEAAARNGTALHFVSRDTRLTFKSGLTIEISVPRGTAAMSSDDNDESLFVKASYGEIDCLFTGDMTSLSEYNFLKSGIAGEAEILKVAHHGSKTSSSDEFIKAVNPEISVISVGADNSYGLPSSDVLERLSGSRILRTDKNGDIKISADKKRIKSIETYLK